MSSDKGKFLIDANVVPGIDLTEVRQQKGVNIYSELIRKAKKLQGSGKKVLICAFSPGSAERLFTILSEYDESIVENIQEYSQLLSLSSHKIGMTILPIEKGFESSEVLFISEPDLSLIHI